MISDRPVVSFFTNPQNSSLRKALASSVERRPSASPSFSRAWMRSSGIWCQMITLGSGATACVHDCQSMSVTVVLAPGKFRDDGALRRLLREAKPSAAAKGSVSGGISDAVTLSETIFRPCALAPAIRCGSSRSDNPSRIRIALPLAGFSQKARSCVEVRGTSSWNLFQRSQALVEMRSSSSPTSRSRSRTPLTRSLLKAARHIS
jgi:hypothetical protein